MTAGPRIRARPPRGEVQSPALLRAEGDVAVYLQDAAHTPGGHAPVVCLPRTEGEVAWVLGRAPAVLPVGAQSSLTGGATPFGEWVLSFARMDALGPLRGDRVEVEAGVPLVTLVAELHRQGRFYPPVPTFHGATVGGTASTNAAGAATFKYGTTRAWVEALTVVLACGEVLDLERGQCGARGDGAGAFEIETAGGVARVPVPGYSMPRVPKRSAGYHAEPGMDLVDLFVGSEGTLGIVTRLTLRVLPEPARLLGWAVLPSEAQALALVRRIRDASRSTWDARDPRGIDVAAIESLDRRSLELLREDGKDRENRVRLDPGAEAALLLQVELPAGTDASRAMDEIGRLGEVEGEADTPDTPLTRLCRLLREHGALDAFEVALPGDARRAEQLTALREAVSLAVNHRIGAAQRAIDPRIRKTAADMIVPFEALPETMALYRGSFARRGLDHALWGHVSDGNLHANAIPRSAEDVRLAEEAILELGDEVIRRAGCPLSEHGVGRNPVKQELLRRLYGAEGVEQMRRVKAALDPEWRLAPGVIFGRG